MNEKEQEQSIKVNQSSYALVAPQFRKSIGDSLQSNLDPFNQAGSSSNSINISTETEELDSNSCSNGFFSTIKSLSESVSNWITNKPLRDLERDYKALIKQMEQERALIADQLEDNGTNLSNSLYVSKINQLIAKGKALINNPEKGLTDPISFFTTLTSLLMQYIIKNHFSNILELIGQLEKSNLEAESSTKTETHKLIKENHKTLNFSLELFNKNDDFNRKLNDLMAFIEILNKHIQQRMTYKPTSLFYTFPNTSSSWKESSQTTQTENNLSTSNLKLEHLKLLSELNSLISHFTKIIAHLLPKDKQEQSLSSTTGLSKSYLSNDKIALLKETRGVLAKLENTMNKALPTSSDTNIADLDASEAYLLDIDDLRSLIQSDNTQQRLIEKEEDTSVKDLLKMLLLIDMVNPERYKEKGAKDGTEEELGRAMKRLRQHHSEVISLAQQIKLIDSSEHESRIENKLKKTN